MNKSTTHIMELDQLLGMLDKLMRPCFGPNALNTMLCTETGKVMLTSRGSALVTSLNMEHPIGRTVVEAAVTHARQTGDHCKTLLLLCASIVKQLRSNQSCVSVQEFVLSIPQLKKALLEKIMASVQERCGFKCNISNDQEMTQTMKSLMRTYFQGKLSVTIIDKFIDLLLNALFHSEAPCSVGEKLDFYIDRYSYMVMECPGKHQLQSELIEGVLIQRNFILNTPGLSQKVPIKFTILRRTKLETAHAISVQSQESLTASIDNKLRVQKCFIDALYDRSVDILFIDDQCSESMLEMCRQRKISVVHFAPEEDLENLEYHSNICPMFEYSDIHDPRCIKEASSVSTLNIAGRVCVLLKEPFHAVAKPNIDSLSDTIKSYQTREPAIDMRSKMNKNEPTCDTSNVGRSSSSKTRTSSEVTRQPIGSEMKKRHLAINLVVCAPSPGLCTELSAMLLSCLRMLRTWIRSRVRNDVVRDSNEAERDIWSNAKNDDVSKNNDCDVSKHMDYDVTDQNSKCDDVNSRFDCDVIEYVYHVQGGGAFELTVHSAISDYMASKSSNLKQTEKDAFGIVQKALLEIPLLLLANSYAAFSSKGMTLAALYKVLGQDREGQAEKSKETQHGSHNTSEDAASAQEKKGNSKNGAGICVNILLNGDKDCKNVETGVDRILGVGINGKTGTECLPVDTWVIQSFASKVHVLTDVLNLLQQVLRVDKVVNVKALPKNEQNEDSDREYTG